MKVHPVNVAVLVLLCGVAAYGVTTGVGSYLRSAGRDAPEDPIHCVVDGLEVELAKLDLGAVWEEREFYHELPIRNQNGFAVDILDFQVSCACLAVQPRMLTIPSGGTGSVRLRLDLTNRKPSEIGLAARPLALEVRPITTRTQPDQASWRIQGVIKSRLTLDRLSMEFGESPIRGQTPRARTLVATIHYGPSQGPRRCIE